MLKEIIAKKINYKYLSHWFFSLYHSFFKKKKQYLGKKQINKQRNNNLCVICAFKQ